MAAKNDFFTSWSSCSGPPILMGDDTPIAIAGERRVELHNGNFENVLHVPNLSMNILSAYQITQKGKKVEFTSDSVYVLDMHDNSIIQLVKWIKIQGCINSLSFMMVTPFFYLHIMRVLCMHL
jgi:hypothetical protein